MLFLHILLMILKWIGIVLAGLIGLLLLIILLILFVPIRYKLQGKKDDEVGMLQAKVTWLLHLIRFSFDWNGGKNTSMKLKILCFTLMDKSAEGEAEEEGPDAELSDEEFDEKLNEAFEQQAPDGTKAEEEQKASAVAEAEQKTDASGDAKAAMAADEQSPESSDEITELHLSSGPASKDSETRDSLNGKAEEEITSATGEAEGQTASAADASDEQTNPEEKASEEKSFDEEDNSLYDKLVRLLEKPFRFMERMSAKKDVVVDFFEDDKNKAGIELSKKLLFKLLKAIAPKGGKGSVTFGTGDPATTGYALAGISILYVQLRGKVRVTPDFENKVFAGEGYFKGRIYLITVLVLFLKLWFNKNFKALKESAQTLKERVKEA